VLHLQGLTLPPHLKQSSQELLRLIQQLGYVQVDSIQWVERAHHMTLFARNQTYRPKDLTRLIEKDRLLFEGWTHDASIIPAEFYPYWRHRFVRQEQKLRKQHVRWQGEGFLDRCEALIERITENGAIRSRDMERPKRDGPQKMWQWHEGKVTLEYLWRTGRLAISGREGFQKVYDLSEKCLQECDYIARSRHNEFIDWACLSALQRLGFGTAADIARYWDLLTIQEVRDWLAQQGKETVVAVEVKSADKSKTREFYARSDIESLLDDLPKLPERSRILSPFDPVIRNRDRLQWLFNFEYRIEIYVPEAKRKYGYYVFPILERDRLIGRIDMRAHRQENELQVKRLWLEQGVRLTPARETRLAAELVRQCRLGGVGKVVWL
jgi:uncharacterized protein YcaQ